MESYGNPHYIIDGYNVVLHKSFSSDKKDIVRERERLLQALDSYAAKKRVKMTVVWDGASMQGPERGRTRVQAVHSGQGRSADDIIVRMVERSNHRRSIIVVSDDRRHITETVRAFGAQVLEVDRFLGLIGVLCPVKRKKTGVKREDDEKKQVVDDLSVEDWMRIFREADKHR